LQRQHGAAIVATGGERAAVEVHDLDRWRPLGDFQRLERRHMRPGPGDGAGRADDQPQAEYQAPIDGAADEQALAARLARLARAFAFCRWLAAAARGAVARRDPQLETAVKHRLPARARLSLALRH